MKDNLKDADYALVAMMAFPVIAMLALWPSRLEWWFPYAFAACGSTLLCFVLGGNWAKRLAGALLLTLCCWLSVWTQNEAYEQIMQPYVAVRHIDPPARFWKTPPIP